jgi:hypothetical protein
LASFSVAQTTQNVKTLKKSDNNCDDLIKGLARSAILQVYYMTLIECSRSVRYELGLINAGKQLGVDTNHQAGLYTLVENFIQELGGHGILGPATREEIQKSYKKKLRLYKAERLGIIYLWLVHKTLGIKLCLRERNWLLYWLPTNG